MNTSQDSASVPQVYAFPVAPLQERIWILDENGDSDPAWNVAVRFQLLGTLSISRFQRALDAVVAQTEILRTHFAISDGEVKQIIPDQLSIPLRFVDYSDSEQFDLQLDTISRQEAESPFRMDSSPLLRVVLVRRDYQAHKLLITAHHAIMDGYSVGLLSDALLTAYEQDDKQTPSLIDDNAPLQFVDYAIWLQEHRKSSEYSEHASYWRRNLEGVLPTDRSCSAPSGSAHIESVLLPRPLTNAAHQLAQRLEVTFSQMALAVMACATCKLDGVIGVPVACRSQVQLEGLIGPFVNYLPIKTAGDSTDSFEQMLAKIADISNEALMHSEYRYEDMLALKGVPKGSLFDTVFICQRDFVQSRVAAGLELTAIPSVSPGALHELTVFLVERSDGWRLSCETDERHKHAYGRELLRRYEAILQAICDEPKASLASLTGTFDSANMSVRPNGSTSPAPLAPSEIFFPASATQERYWALDRIDPDNSSLNLHIRYAVDGVLDYEAFRRTIYSLGGKHDALRTTFLEKEGNVQQRISIAFEIPLRHIERINEALDDDAIAELFETEKRLQFDLERGPLWGALLVTSLNRSYFSLTFAHSICDGWSCGIIMRDLLTTYEAIIAGRKPEYPLLPVSFGKIAEEESRTKQTKDFSTRLAYWDNILSSPGPSLKLPTDHMRGATAVQTRVIDPMLSMTVSQLAKDYSVTTASVYTAAYRALLLKYTGASDLLIASPMANRTPGTENVVGPFADSLLLRSNIGETFEDALQATQNTLLAAVEHNVPLQYLMERFRRNPAERGPSVSIGFMYQEAFVRDLTGERLSLHAMSNPILESSFDWYMAVIDRSGEVSVEFTPTRSTMSEELAAAILEDFELSLSGYVMAPQKPLGRINGGTQRVLQIVQASPIEEQPVAAVTEPQFKTEISLISDERTAKMVQIWQSVFGRVHITWKDNFFALGGHSLLLARLQVAIEKEFGYRVFAADIFAAPTCELLVLHMAKKLKSAPASLLEQVIPLQPEGDETPLFMISQSMIMREFAQRLGSNQPSFTIQFTQEDVERIGCNATMQEVAALYIEYLCKVSPRGPYRLGGWCVSGWVAYEMAQQLKAAGEDVELLLILDAWAPNFWRDQRGLGRILNRCSYYAHRAYFETCRLLPRDLTIRALSSGIEPLQRAVRERATQVFEYIGLKSREAVFIDEPFEQMMEFAAASYRPKPYGDNRTMIFRSEEQPRGGTLPNEMGWRRLLPAEVKMISLPGDHTGMFSGPGAIMLASSIRRKTADQSAITTQEDIVLLKSTSDQLDVPSCLS